MFPQVKCPEDLFGVVTPKAEYYALLKKHHPDLGGSNEATQLINQWWVRAQNKMRNGTYGDGKPEASAVVRLPSGEWTLSGPARDQNGFSYYSAECGDRAATLKLGNTPGTRTYLTTEKQVLNDMNDARGCNGHTWPAVLDIADVPGPNHTRKPGLLYLEGAAPDSVSLRRVIAAYPNGVDPRDSAWMINRMVEVANFSSELGWAHTGLTLDNVYISPSQHSVFVDEWHFAVKHGGVAKIAPAGFTGLRAYEVVNKRPVSATTDLHAIAGLAVMLMRGDKALTGQLRLERHIATIRIAGLINSCLLSARPFSSVGQFHAEFADALQRAYGPRRFRPFTLPTT